MNVLELVEARSLSLHRECDSCETRACRRDRCRRVAAMRHLAIACAAVCLVVGSRAADAAWFENYAQVAQDIATHGFDSSGGLPQGFTLAVPTPEASGKIRMQYNFAWNDPVFGTVSGGLLSNTTVGSAGYNLHLIKDVAERPSTITLPKSTSTYNQGALPWLSVAGTRLAYMQARTDQWDLSLTPFDPSPLNPWRRNAAVVGMAYDVEQRVTGGNYANNYVVTFDIDPQYVLRPNANQLVSNGTAASAPMTLNQQSLYDIDASWSQAWSAGAATPAIYNSDGSAINTSLSDLLRSQWDDNTLTAAFPFTGIGYTYDWYYQDRSKWTDSEGVGLAEFIAMPSTDAYDVVVDIVSVQTTAQFLGASAAFPNVTPVPEPAMTLPAALAASLFLANRLSRQRRTQQRR